MSNYPTDETMAWIWEVKEKISRDIQGMSAEEIMAYFEEHSKAAREKLEAARSEGNKA